MINTKTTDSKDQHSAGDSRNNDDNPEWIVFLVLLLFTSSILSIHQLVTQC